MEENLGKTHKSGEEEIKNCKDRKQKGLGRDGLNTRPIKQLKNEQELNN